MAKSQRPPTAHAAAGEPSQASLLAQAPSAHLAASDAAAPAASFEAAARELDALVNAMEAGQMPLDELLEQYQRGMALLAFCRQRLQVVSEQVQLLDADGLDGAKPLASEATT